MSKKKRKVPEINSSSTADIAFLLLIFFLVTTTMAVNKGLARRLPPPVPADQKTEDLKVKERNVFVVLINSDNQLLVQNEYMDISKLKTKAKEFIVNNDDDPNMPEKSVVNIDYFGNVMVTKDHVISLQNDRGTSYSKYIEVQNELVAAYNELRNDLARTKWGVSYEELDESKQNAVQKYFPQKISEAEPKNYGGNK
ncbi:MAG: biopolymer transporter ExbD [Paludibacteraceae bacterium]|jgi:biopolymer transport protein ExbD|nr:biopolymer transporter ExbD [Paludibacteraceae bacterium]OQA48330.1 MAG: Biopolymer transport protein ExbD/TolR [Bacteroidetes bacterium ADurb.Bin302]HOH96276.1 biopolymer transporter ExbD [Candidatus Enterocola sp.]HPG55845.1 biopolymer transporter ExbD [Candidatus Enterocola sp.]